MLGEVKALRNPRQLKFCICLQENLVTHDFMSDDHLPRNIVAFGQYGQKVRHSQICNKLKNLKASRHATPMKCTPGGVHAREMHAYEVHAHKVHIL
jgi:hypothetical protein